MRATLPAEVFWSRVQVNIHDVDACWLYIDPCGFRMPSGHVRIAVGAGRHEFAHRYAAFLAWGPLDGWCVCHQCDIAWCCSPAHLALGDRVRNCAEREWRNRRTPNLLRGPDHPRARLTRQKAELIRRDRGAGVSLRVLAETHHVSSTTVRHVLSGRRYLNNVVDDAADELSLFSREEGQSQ